MLGSLSTDFWSQGAIVLALQQVLNRSYRPLLPAWLTLADPYQAIETWTRDHEITALASVCTMLVEMPDVLEVTFLHAEPRSILKPICEFLEAFDSSVETFGPCPTIL